MQHLFVALLCQITSTCFVTTPDRGLESPLQKCTNLKNLQLENTTILDATHVPAGSKITTPGSCQSSALSTAIVCRVQALVNTTSTSAVHFEAWLPDEWYGRFLALGNGGLAGCIDYPSLDYGSILHFASVASDNGHDGGVADGRPFLHRPEVINDFAFRAIHIETVLGKKIVEAYYGKPHSKSYFVGCSTGGRQAIQSALKFPDDFDGVVAGAPATNFHHIIGETIMLGRYIGAPSHTAPEFIPAKLWPVISQEILNQCDDLDGVVDGIITDPDLCIFRPEALLCSGSASRTCLSGPQVEALRKIYQPLFGTQGQLLYPRYDPSSESDGKFVDMFSGDPFPIAADWFKFAIFNDSSYSFHNFSAKDIEFADTINPGGISTWDGDLSPFKNRGGKIITYHGRQDQLIPSGNSLRFYNLISSTLSLANLDEFYRLFLVPGMAHCFGGPGAWAIGQGIIANLVNSTSNNVLLALVDWVENDHAPNEIIGTVPGTMAQRAHCRYPQKSVFNGKAFVCRA